MPLRTYKLIVFGRIQVFWTIFFPASPQCSPRNDSFVSSCCPRDVTYFIRQHVAGATLSSETLRELTYTLPSEAAQKGTLEGLFAELSGERLDSLCLSGYGLMDSSLEQVFLKVADKYGVNKTGKLEVICLH